MGDPFGHGEKEQVVIAQYGLGGEAKILDQAQDAEGVRASVDEITDEPEPIGAGLKGDAVQQIAERVEAPLNVADRVGGHTSE